MSKAKQASVSVAANAKAPDAVKTVLPAPIRVCSRLPIPAEITARVGQLLTMLTYKRPAWSSAETAFIARYIDSVLGMESDTYGNRIMRVPCANGAPAPVMWSCHTDTVHRTSGTQHILYGQGIASSDSGECLGADCTTGVWVMLQLIAARVPGTYVFHRAEEIGGLGSRHIASNTPELLEGIRFAVAFDRKGYDSVITEQCGLTASVMFAKAMARALNDAHPAFSFSEDPSGVFTDTANYAGTVPECTNLSVGYFSQHSPGECQDIPFACALADAIVHAFSDPAAWESMPCVRDPLEVEDYRTGSWEDYYRLGAGGKTTTLDYSVFATRDMENYVYSNTGLVADFLTECGYSLEDLKEYARDNR
jgi:hypothetical protein